MATVWALIRKHGMKIPEESAEEYETFVAAARKRIDPWLSPVFQAERLNLRLASGFTTAIAAVAGANVTAKVNFDPTFDSKSMLMRRSAQSRCPATGKDESSQRKAVRFCSRC